MRVPFADLNAQYLSIKNEIDSAMANVIAESAFIGGHFVKDFEEQFANAYGVKHVTGCGNGTDSLYIIMKMLGIGNGDEVITPANSWISSSESITQAGAKPVFVDVHPCFFTIDESQIENKITEKTKAIIAVHLHGQMCEMEKIKFICERHKLFLIEDCAQSHFSEYKATKAGLFGIAGSFSFYPGKNLGAYGDAGCIITNNDELATKCKIYARHGALIKHQHQVEGINSRLDGIQAAILSAKLPYVETWTEKRTENADLYNNYLSGIEEIVLPHVRPNTKHTYHLYVIRAQRRNELMKFLSDKNIETSLHYPTPLPFLPAYKYLDHKTSDYPVSAQLQKEILSLPMYAELTEEMIRYVSDNIKEFYKK
ncbi:MAG TPA: DegT/DnrJ/EryC1/StrS family aminotransferase [Puia sp.]|nr:DegT/DnrJ/EryC1/StrS family aminotransferase [Puia sp.]